MCEFESKTCNFAKQIQQPNSIAMNRFFKPFVGTKYEEGICGKKILVLGASFYCNKNGENGQRKCPFFDECTNTETKDSSKFDAICSEYKGKDMQLSNEPSYAIDERYLAYRNFERFMQQFIDDESEDVWQRMAFTNYLQFFSPTIKTEKSYLSQRDFEAFCETLRELQPNVVISWGMATLEEIREKNSYITDINQLPKTDYYVCHMRNVPGVNHEITLVSSYHPSSVYYWYNDIEKLEDYVKQVLIG